MRAIRGCIAHKPSFTAHQVMVRIPSGSRGVAVLGTCEELLGWLHAIWLIVYDLWRSCLSRPVLEDTEPSGVSES